MELVVRHGKEKVQDRVKLDMSEGTCAFGTASRPCLERFAKWRIVCRP